MARVIRRDRPDHPCIGFLVRAEAVDPFGNEATAAEIVERLLENFDVPQDIVSLAATRDPFGTQDLHDRSLPDSAILRRPTSPRPWATAHTRYRWRSPDSAARPRRAQVEPDSGRRAPVIARTTGSPAAPATFLVVRQCHAPQLHPGGDAQPSGRSFTDNVPARRLSPCTPAGTALIRSRQCH